MKTIKTFQVSLTTTLIAILLSSCATLYDHYTYTETIETKIQTLSIMDLSHQPYTNHEAEVTALKNQIEKMVIYEKGKNKNKITIKMWEVLDNDNKLIKSYLQLWQDRETLNMAFIEEAKPQIEEAFNILIQYEEKKSKTNGSIILDFISNL